MSDSTEPVAVVLAAGKGKRMNADVPKVLCRANGRPIIEYVLDSLRQAGVGRIVVVVGFRAELVRESLSRYSNLEFVTQSQQLGTGHAVMVCREQLVRFSGPVAIVAGDSPMLQSETVRRLLEDYRQHRAECVLGTLIHDDPAGLGRIVRDERGEFRAIVEDKDCTEAERRIREVNMSTYLVECRWLLSALDQLTNENKQGEYYVTDVPGILKEQGLSVRALPILQPCEALSVNTPEQLAAVEREMVRLHMC